MPASGGSYLGSAEGAPQDRASKDGAGATEHDLSFGKGG